MNAKSIKVAMIGATQGRPGLGAAIAAELTENGYEMTVFSRPTIDIANSDWIQFLDQSYDIVILNAFDHKNPEAQTKAFQLLFEKFKFNPSTHLAVIGSMAHYFEKVSPYAKAKAELYDYFINIGKFSTQYECRLLLFEPGTLENRIAILNQSLTYMTLEEAARSFRQALEMNLKFLHLAVRGRRKSTERIS